MNKAQRLKCRTILDHYGFENQQNKLVEECEELIEAASGDDYENFIEELADVTIMIQQMYLSLSLEQKSQYHDMIETKLNRTLQRM